MTNTGKCSQSEADSEAKSTKSLASKKLEKERRKDFLSTSAPTVINCVELTEMLPLYIL